MIRYRLSEVLNANTPHARGGFEGDGQCTLVRSVNDRNVLRAQRPEPALGGGAGKRGALWAAQPGARPVHVGVARKISAGLGVANWHRPATAAEGDIFGSRNRDGRRVHQTQGNQTFRFGPVPNWSKFKI